MASSRSLKRAKHPQNISKTSVLVTGGSGFIGRAVARLLQQSGERALLLDVWSQNHPDDHQHSQTIRCDITNVAELERVFEEQPIGGIIHLAAILPTTAQKEPVRATQVNLQGSLNLLEAARKSGVKRFVFGSSLSIYGSLPADHAVSEMVRAAPEDLYGAAKLYVERLGSAYATHGLEFVSLRIGRVVGEGARSQTSAWRSQIFEFLPENRPVTIILPYVGSERVLLVHVADVAKMLLTLLRGPRLAQTVYNAPCESVMVSDLKQQVETLNPKIKMQLGSGVSAGNPRQLDSSRFQREFGFVGLPIFERLRKAAGA